MNSTIDPEIWKQLGEELAEEAEREMRSAFPKCDWRNAVCATYECAEDLPEDLDYVWDEFPDTLSTFDSVTPHTNASDWKESVLSKFPQAKTLPDDLLNCHLAADELFLQDDTASDAYESGHLVSEKKNSAILTSALSDVKISTKEVVTAQYEQAMELPEDLCRFDLTLSDDANDHNAALKSLLNKTPPRRSRADLLDSASRVAEGQERYTALSDLAEIAAHELPLMVFEHELYLRLHTVWQPIDVSQLAYELSNRGYQDLIAALSKKNRDELFQRVLLIPKLQRSVEELRNSPTLLPCKDGVFDMQTMCPRPIADRDGFFSCLDISAYEIGGNIGNTFESFVGNLSNGNMNVRQRLLEIIGVILSGYMPKSFFVFIGPHDTGKSQVANLLRRLVGDRCVGSISDPNVLSGDFGFSMLPGKKLCYCPDAAEISFSKNTVAAVKQITGGDLLYLNKKYREPVTFLNEAKLLFLSNHPLKGQFDEAMKRRAVVLPFQNTVPPSKQIPDLADKLYGERGYIVYQAISALRKLVERDFEYTPVEGTDSGVYASVAELMDGEALNIRNFVKNCCVFRADAKSTVSLLYNAYQAFCEKNGCESCNNITTFSRTFRQCYPHIDDFRTSSARGFTGIALCKTPM